MRRLKASTEDGLRGNFARRLGFEKDGGHDRGAIFVYYQYGYAEVREKIAH